MALLRKHLLVPQCRDWRTLLKGACNTTRPPHTSAPVGALQPRTPQKSQRPQTITHQLAQPSPLPPLLLPELLQTPQQLLMRNQHIPMHSQKDSKVRLYRFEISMTLQPLGKGGDKRGEVREGEE